jgi:alanine racemase
MGDARAWVEVDLGALVRNARALAAHSRVPLVPMVKADAYGLGAVAVTRVLEPLDPLAYGVSSVAEGEELRAAGITRPIIHFTPALAVDFARLRRAGMTPTLGARDVIEAWAASGGGDWHLAIDTGMHRAGVNDGALDDLLDAAAAHAPAGAFTHFHSSEMDDGSMERQEARFRAAIARLPVRPRLLHADNSGAIVRRSPSEWDCVRPGVFLYGVGSWQMADGRGVGLSPEPVASLRARILEVRTIGPGDSVSYGATWKATRVTKVATVACGYADGLRRALGNHAHALVLGQPAPILGVVTMDMAMLDVTACDGQVGDVATFLGRDGTALLTVESLAAKARLSPYELLVGLKLRLPRFYTGT